MQLRDAVAREDYADAAKLKLAISGAEKNDTVGSALSDLSVRIKPFDWDLHDFVMSWFTV